MLGSSPSMTHWLLLVRRRVIDQDVRRAERLRRRGKKILPGLFTGNIRLLIKCVGAEFLRQRLAIGNHIGNDDLGAFREE